MVEYNGVKYYTYKEVVEDIENNSKPDWMTWDAGAMLRLLNIEGIPYIKTQFGWCQISKSEYFRHRRKGIELYG